MTATALRPADIDPAGPIPRGTCLGKRNPKCTARYHGTWPAYKRGCTCPHAREARRIYDKRRRQHRAADHHTDPTGSRRRLQALAAIGWRWDDIGEHLGVTGPALRWILHAQAATVRTTTAARVAALYDRLSSTPGPSAVTRRRALAKGWVPPLAWDDDTIDDPAAQPNLGGDDSDVVDEIAARRALSGERVRLNEAERVIAVRLGLDRGMTITAVAKQLHISYERARALAPEDWTADTTTRAA